ncbi:hypothetical protein D3C81_1928050 [compost metagenome]
MFLAENHGIIDRRIRIAFLRIELAQTEADPECIEKRTVQILLGQQPFIQRLVNDFYGLFRFFGHTVDAVLDRFRHGLGK